MGEQASEWQRGQTETSPQLKRLVHFPRAFRLILFYCFTGWGLRLGARLILPRVMTRKIKTQAILNHGSGQMKRVPEMRWLLLEEGKQGSAAHGRREMSLNSKSP